MQNVSSIERERLRKIREAKYGPVVIKRMPASTKSLQLEKSKTKWRHPKAYPNVVGVLGKSLTLPQIFELAEVPKSEWNRLEKIYNNVVHGKHNQAKSRIYGLEVFDELNQRLKEATKGQLDLKKMPPSLLPDFLPYSYGVISKPDIQAKSVLFPNLKNWKTVFGHGRAVFKKEGQYISQVKGTGRRIKKVPSSMKNLFDENYPFTPHTEYTENINGASFTKGLAYDFAATLEVIDALKKHRLWNKFKDKIRIPLNELKLKETPLHVDNKILNIKKYLEQMLSRPSIGKISATDTLNEGAKLGQTHYVAKNPYRRLIRYVQQDYWQEFMRAQGFKGADIKLKAKRAQAVGNFTKDLAVFLRTMHKEGIVMADKTLSSIAQKDIGPGMEIQDFDIIKAKRFGEEVRKEDKIKDVNYAISLVKNLCTQMELDPNYFAQNIFKKRYNTKIK